MPFKYIKDEDGNFVCPHCGVVKKNQNTMHYHLKKHEEKLTFNCKVCKKGFLQKSALDLHIHSKHPELAAADDDSIKKWKCPFDDCSFSALTKGNCIIHCLRVHFQDEIKTIMSVDSESKEIECTECDKCFSSSCAFYYHCKSCVPFDEKSVKYDKFKSIA
jgi:hypothetical protein